MQFFHPVELLYLSKSVFLGGLSSLFQEVPEKQWWTPTVAWVLDLLQRKELQNEHGAPLPCSWFV